MSTIVVAKKGGKTVIAADTLTTFGYTKQGWAYASNKDKIIKFKASYIGVVGSAAHNLVLRTILKKHQAQFDFTSPAAVFESYLKLHGILKERYYLNTREGKDEEETGFEPGRIDALVANANGIFGMHAGREIFQYQLFAAIGSGKDYALGAMFGIYDRADNAEEIAVTAIRASCDFDDGSSLPYTIYTIDS